MGHRTCNAAKGMGSGPAGGARGGEGNVIGRAGNTRQADPGVPATSVLAS
jgi:hypothetical protein